MDRTELILLAAGFAVIVVAIVVVFVLPPLGGDPNKADGTDSGMGPD